MLLLPLIIEHTIGERPPLPATPRRCIACADAPPRNPPSNTRREEVRMQVVWPSQEPSTPAVVAAFAPGPCLPWPQHASPPTPAGLLWRETEPRLSPVVGQPDSHADSPPCYHPGPPPPSLPHLTPPTPTPTPAAQTALPCAPADERSPLCGHTHDSLLALNAEVVVTFEGTTEVRDHQTWPAGSSQGGGRGGGGPARSQLRWRAAV